MSRGKRVYTDDLAFRVKPAQREFLEKYADDHDMGLCQAARFCIDEMMKREGLTS